MDPKKRDGTELGEIPHKMIGKKQGIEIGEKRGEHRDTLQTQKRILIHRICQQFTDIPENIQNQIEETQDVEQLDAWLEALFRTKSLDEIF